MVTSISEVLSNINYWAVLAATLSSMIVGMVFYHPKVMGAGWQRAVGHTGESVQRGSKLIYLVPVVASICTAWVLAAVTGLAFAASGGSYFIVTTVCALVLYVGFTAARVLVHDAFDPRKFTVTGYTLLNEAITIFVMAIIIGVWPPSGL
ncbi:DUF1761 domain-containing protein [Mycobacterium sp.]|uniref:DUF1761 domain-containing protein n=1 Tax=Mycobacterium sp. TaxID=1785 RepID=UPI003A8483C3